LKNNFILMRPISFLPLLYFSFCPVLAQAPQASSASQIFWSEAGSGKVKVQVQNFAGDVPPSLRAYALSDREAEPVKVPELKAMGEVGFWETPVWDVSQVKPGIYFLGESAPAAAWDPLDSQGGFKTTGAEILHQEGIIKWKQAVPGATRVLLQSSSGLMIGSPSGWVITGAGDASVKWNGKGDDGVDYRFQPSISAVVQIAEFHKELLVVGDATNGAFAESSKKLVESLALPPATNLAFSCKALSPEGVPQKACEPGGALKVELPAATSGILQGKRFEILIYVDGVFVHEESQGVNPYVYRIPSSVPGSSKTISINLVDYEGASGIVTLPFASGK
jgi:hypothetical protein